MHGRDPREFRSRGPAEAACLGQVTSVDGSTPVCVYNLHYSRIARGGCIYYDSNDSRIKKFRARGVWFRNGRAKLTSFSPP